MADYYQIVKVEPIIKFDPVQGLIKGYRVYFTVCGKITDWVDVSEQEFLNNEYVRKVEELANKLRELYKC